MSIRKYGENGKYYHKATYLNKKRPIFKVMKNGRFYFRGENLKCHIWQDRVFPRSGTNRFPGSRDCGNRTIPL